MKTIKYILVILVLSVSFVSCSDDENDDDIIEVNPVADLNKIYEFPLTDRVIEIYSAKQGLEVGYNELSIRVKDLAADKYLENIAISWMPMMHMETMMHSAPHSDLSNSEENSVYTGHIVFQMPGNATEFWDVTFDYTFNGETVSETHQLSVMQPVDGLKKTQVFMGADDVRYVLAYVSPVNPEVAVNDFEAVLYKMENMMSFPLVENYTITVDPRMPGMGNHGSPNNEDLHYNSVTKTYQGKLSLTMTGYWRVNLKLMNENDETLKGEDVTEANPESSLYFELEF